VFFLLYLLKLIRNRKSDFLRSGLFSNYSIFIVLLQSTSEYRNLKSRSLNELAAFWSRYSKGLVFKWLVVVPLNGPNYTVNQIAVQFLVQYSDAYCILILKIFYAPLKMLKVHPNNFFWVGVRWRFAKHTKRKNISVCLFHYKTQHSFPRPI
jgi:hypothetical protein